MPDRRAAAALCIVAAGCTLCAALWAGADAPGISAARALAFECLGVQSFFAALALAAARLGGGFRADLGLGASRLTGPELALAAAGLLGLSLGLDALHERAGLPPMPGLDRLEAALRSSSRADHAWVLFGVAIAPGLAEELLCRGAIQGALVRRHGPALAVPLSAAIFGALHLEVVHGLLAGALGLYLGALAVLAGSIRATILCHMLNNAVAIGLYSAELPGPHPPALIPLGFGLALFALVRLRRAAVRRAVETGAAASAPPCGSALR